MKTENSLKIMFSAHALLNISNQNSTEYFEHRMTVLVLVPSSIIKTNK